MLGQFFLITFSCRLYLTSNEYVNTLCVFFSFPPFLLSFLPLIFSPFSPSLFPHSAFLPLFLFLISPFFHWMYRFGVYGKFFRRYHGISVKSGKIVPSIASIPSLYWKVSLYIHTMKKFYQGRLGRAALGCLTKKLTKSVYLSELLLCK